MSPAFLEPDSIAASLFILALIAVPKQAAEKISASISPITVYILTEGWRLTKSSTALPIEAAEIVLEKKNSSPSLTNFRSNPKPAVALRKPLKIGVRMSGIRATTTLNASQIAIDSPRVSSTGDVFD